MYFCRNCHYVKHDLDFGWFGMILDCNYILGVLGCEPQMQNSQVRRTSRFAHEVQLVGSMLPGDLGPDQGLR